MLYALDAQDVVRIRKLLIAFEQGRLNRDVMPVAPPSQAGRQDTMIAYVPSPIPAASVVSSVTYPGTATAQLYKYDTTQSPAPLVAITSDKTFHVLNLNTTPLDAGFYLIARDPSSGYWVPLEAIDPLTWQTNYNDPATYTWVQPAGTYQTFASITLPYLGWYSLKFTFQAAVSWTGTPGGIAGVLAQLYDTTNGVVILNPVYLFDGSFTAGGATYNDVVFTLTANYQVTSGAPNVALQAQLVSVSGVTYNTSLSKISRQNISAELLSPGALASATTINGQSGGVNLVPASGGGQAPGGIGVTVNTSSGQVTIGLSSAATAAMNEALAGGNW